MDGARARTAPGFDSFTGRTPACGKLRPAEGMRKEHKHFSSDTQEAVKTLSEKQDAPRGKRSRIWVCICASVYPIIHLLLPVLWVLTLLEDTGGP